MGYEAADRELVQGTAEARQASKHSSIYRGEDDGVQEQMPRLYVFKTVSHRFLTVFKDGPKWSNFVRREIIHTDTGMALEHKTAEAISKKNEGKKLGKDKNVMFKLFVGSHSEHRASESDAPMGAEYGDHETAKDGHVTAMKVPADWLLVRDKPDPQGFA